MSWARCLRACSVSSEHCVPSTSPQNSTRSNSPYVKCQPEASVQFSWRNKYLSTYRILVLQIMTYNNVCLKSPVVHVRHVDSSLCAGLYLPLSPQNHRSSSPQTRTEVAVDAVLPVGPTTPSVHSLRAPRTSVSVSGSWPTEQHSSLTITFSGWGKCDEKPIKQNKKHWY